MKVADLYIRVSTDAQADKGYSQSNQEEVLRSYCNSNDIQINHVILEDHSAKSFVRPEWVQYLNLISSLKINRNWCSLPNGTVSAVIQATHIK